MSRPVTERMAQAMLAGNPRVAFCQINHPSGTGYFHTGIGPIDWNGHTWSGSGSLGAITPVKHSSEIATQDIVFTVSGVDADLIAKLDDDIHNRAAYAWLACLDYNGKVIPDPYQLVDAELDTQMFEIADDGTATISITAHTGFYILDYAVEEAWTPENQHLKFPGDTGFDMIPSLVNKDLPWTPT